MNGFGRVIAYKDEEKVTGETPAYVFAMWEGQIENGDPMGFARMITSDDSFVGYMSGR